MKHCALKKLISAAAALCLCIAMAGCGDKGSQSSEMAISDVDKAISQAEANKGKAAVDPFETLKLSFSGRSPRASVMLIDNNEKYLYGSEMQGWHSIFEFTADKTENLKNGDVITVTAKQVYGEDKYYLSQTEKEYTVEGLDLELTKIADIRSGDIDSLVKKCDGFIDKDATEWNDNVKLKDKKFIGCCLLTGKDDDWLPGTSKSNYLYFVYKIDYTATGVPEDSKDDKKQTIDDTYYTFFKIESAALNSDGSLRAEFEESTMKCYHSGSGEPSEKFEHGGFSDPYSYDGYSDIESLYKDIKYSENTVLDTTVNENA